MRAAPVRRGSRYSGGSGAVATLSTSTSPVGSTRTSPGSLPRSACATGAVQAIRPALGSASSSPTMRKLTYVPSARATVTSAPNTTRSVWGSGSTTSAESRRAVQ